MKLSIGSYSECLTDMFCCVLHIVWLWTTWEVRNILFISKSVNEYFLDLGWFWILDLLLWRSEGKRPLRFLRSFPLRLVWKRSSSPWPSQCPPLPGPGRSQGALRGRSSRSGCCHSALEQWRRNWSGESKKHKHIISNTRNTTKWCT